MTITRKIALIYITGMAIAAFDPVYAGKATMSGGGSAKDPITVHHFSKVHGNPSSSGSNPGGTPSGKGGVAGGGAGGGGHK